MYSRSAAQLSGLEAVISEPGTFGGGTVELLNPDRRQEEGRDAGSMSFGLDADGSINIGSVGVLPRLQRRGVATRLFQALRAHYPDVSVFTAEAHTEAGYEWLERLVADNPGLTIRVRDRR